MEAVRNFAHDITIICSRIASSPCAIVIRSTCWKKASYKQGEHLTSSFKPAIDSIQ